MTTIELGRTGRQLHAEWTKLRTVRGWVIGLILAGLLTAGVAMLNHSECGGIQPDGTSSVGGPGCAVLTGPGGEAVTDGFYFVHRPLGPAGSLTVRVASLAGQALQPWSKAGIIIKASTVPGSAYAAMMVTGGHGVRMQWDYTQDTSGLAGPGPRWLRLTRSGAVITGYDSADGAHWTRVGTATLAGLPATVQAGLFAASPDASALISSSGTGSSASGGQTEATARFDHVAIAGSRPGGGWTGTEVGTAGGAGGPPGLGYRSSGGTATVTGTGDIAPSPAGGQNGGYSVAQPLIGTFAGLIAVIVVATMFITAEYRRGLIRVTLAASPWRSRVLASKAIVIGLAAFAVTLPGAWAALLIEPRLMRSRGVIVDPVTRLTEVRLLAGTAALVAVVAILTVAIGAIVRHSAAAVAIVMALIVLPYFFAVPLMLLPAGAADWLLRVTPAAGFAIQQPYPAYPQVTASYTPGNGYYPLAPWAGFAVLCAWTALALIAAGYLLRRRDA
jgi:ABC-type transport system involved in multi-copper enzyme maturation permease subunit